MQSGGRLIQNVQRASRCPLREFLRELDALRFAARQRGRALSQANVRQPHVEQGLQFRLHGRHGGKERQRVLDREVENFLDVFALEADFQGLAVVAPALADIAGHVNVGEKMHFHFDHAVALTGFAASALDVEAESSRFISPRPRFRDGGEDLPNRREQPRVRGRVGAGRTADRTLVDLDHPVDVVEAFDAVEVRGSGRGMVELRRHRPKQGVVDQGRFTRSRNPGDAGQQPQRKFRRDVLQIVGRRADHPEHALRIRRTPLRRNLDAATAAQILSRDRLGMRGDLVSRTLRHDPAAMHARAYT